MFRGFAKHFLLKIFMELPQGLSAVLNGVLHKVFQGGRQVVQVVTEAGSRADAEDWEGQQAELSREIK